MADGPYEMIKQKEGVTEIHILISSLLSVFIWLNIVFTVCSTILFCKAYVLCPALFAEWRLLWEENKHYDSYIQLSLLPLEARSASNQGFSCLIFFQKRFWQTKYIHYIITLRDNHVLMYT
jgi:hypothetical protein